MQKTEIMALTIAGVVTLIMIGLTRIPAYVEAMNNWLLLILLLFAMTAIFGMGFNGLFFGRKERKER